MDEEEKEGKSAKCILQTAVGFSLALTQLAGMYRSTTAYEAWALTSGHYQLYYFAVSPLEMQSKI